jgi:hypothetical protein
VEFLACLQRGEGEAEGQVGPLSDEMIEAVVKE